VARFALDADQRGFRSSLSGLEGGSELEGMGGDDAVIVIGGDDHGGGIIGGLKVVVGGVAVEVEKVFFLVGLSVFGLPGPADGEFVKAEHVHDANGRKGGSEEFRSLNHAGSDKETSIRASGDGELWGGGVFLSDEVFGTADEVIEDILFFKEHAGFVPFLAVFAAATEICHDVDATHVHPGDGGGRVGGAKGDVEASVGVEEGGI